MWEEFGEQCVMIFLVTRMQMLYAISSDTHAIVSIYTFMHHKDIVWHDSRKESPQILIQLLCGVFLSVHLNLH